MVKQRTRRTGGVVEPVGGSLFRYIETSALVAALLDEDQTARVAVRGEGRRVASALTFTEAARALLQARIGGRLESNEERLVLRRLRRFERRCETVAVSEAVLTRAARPFPVEPIRTLDAIHLATVELLGEMPQLVTIVTRDRRVRDNAISIGYAVE